MRDVLYCPECATGMVAIMSEGRLRQVCPACGYVAYRQLKTGAGVLVERDGELLLVQRGPGVAFAGAWGLPAGYCEVDESPRETAAREASEETGCQMRVGSLVDVYHFDDDPRGNGLLLIYRAEITGGHLCCDSTETTAVGFFPADGLPQPHCGGGHDRAIDAWRARAADRWQPGSSLRYCSHCTHPLEERVAFGRVRPLCPACGFVHFQDLKVGVSVLVEQEGRVLLIRRGVAPGLGKWGLPSGFIEWDESPAAAAVRETVEETGLEISDLDLIDVRHYTDDFRGPGINLLYRACPTGGYLQAGDDAEMAQYFSPAELPEPGDIAFRGHRQILSQWSAALMEPARKG